MILGNPRQWRLIAQYMVAWTLAFIFLSFVRGEGTEELGSVQFELMQAFLASMMMGPIFGAISGIAQVLTEEYGYKQISLRKLFLFRLVYAILFVIAIILLGYAIYGKDISLYQFAFEPGSFSIYFYIVFVDIFLFGLRQVNLYFGENNLWKLLRGKYYHPHEEDRILMFLDLKSSTTHAERLGHIRYSAMIRDCFNDLGVVMDYGAEIYQYVGDEAILTWSIKRGTKHANCLRAFFRFKDQLAKRRAYYMKEYDAMPVFKAGIHAGIVTVTEVGKFKKEIAYHGDTINTAARIQGKCNELQQELLISGSLKDQLDTEEYRFDRMGSLALRGKQEEVSVFAVREVH